eukprot:g17260.t1
MVFISAAFVRVSLLSYYGCKTRVRVLLSTLLTFSVVYEVVANQIVWASRAWMLCILADPGPRPPTPTASSASKDTATEATSAAAARLFGLVFAQAILTALKTFFTTLLALAFRTALVGNLTHRYYQKLDVGCGQTDGAEEEVGETLVDHRLCEDARLFSAGLPQMVVSLLIVPCALCYYSARLAAYDIHGTAATPAAPNAAPSTSEHQIVHRREEHQWGAPPTTSPESSVGGWLPLLLSHLAPAKAVLVRHLGSLFSSITWVPNKLMLCVLLALYAYFGFFTAVGAFLTHLTTPKRERVQFLEGRLRALHVRQRACRDEIALLDGGASAERAEHRRAFSHTLLPALKQLVGYQDGALSFFQSLFAYLGTPVCYFAVGVAFLSVVGNNTPSTAADHHDHDTPQDRYGKISAGVLSALMVLKSMTDLVQLFKTATDVGGYARRIDELVGDLFERTTLAAHKNFVADLERSERAEEDDNIFPFAPFQIRSTRRSCVSDDFDSESSSPGTSGGLSTWWRWSTRGRSLLSRTSKESRSFKGKSSIEMTALALNTTQRREQAKNNAKEPLLRDDEGGAQEQDLLLRVGSASAGATASAAPASLASRARNRVPRHTRRTRNDLHEVEAPLLQLNNVTLRAPGRPPGGVVLLKELSFQVFRRKHLLVKGPSGCGKSTLVKALAFGHYEGANDFLRSPGSFCKVLTLPQKPYIFPAHCLLEVVFYGLDSTEHRRRATSTSSYDRFIHRSPEVAELVHRAKQSFVLMATTLPPPDATGASFDSASLAAWLLFYVRKLKLQPLFMRFCISRRGREVDAVGEVAAEREQEGDAEIDFPRLLSPGEAQRIAALRVLLRLRLYEGLTQRGGALIRAETTSMDVLVLVDEGSSHLDEDGEAALYEELCAVGGAGAAVGGQQSTVSVTLVSFSHREKRQQKKAEKGNKLHSVFEKEINEDFEKDENTHSNRAPRFRSYAGDFSFAFSAPCYGYADWSDHLFSSWGDSSWHGRVDLNTPESTCYSDKIKRPPKRTEEDMVVPLTPGYGWPSYEQLTWSVSSPPHYPQDVYSGAGNPAAYPSTPGGYLSPGMPLMAVPPGLQMHMPPQHMLFQPAGMSGVPVVPALAATTASSTGVPPAPPSGAATSKNATTTTSATSSATTGHGKASVGAVGLLGGNNKMPAPPPGLGPLETAGAVAQLESKENKENEGPPSISLSNKLREQVMNQLKEKTPTATAALISAVAIDDDVINAKNASKTTTAATEEEILTLPVESANQEQGDIVRDDEEQDHVPEQLDPMDLNAQMNSDDLRRALELETPVSSSSSPLQPVSLQLPGAAQPSNTNPPESALKPRKLDDLMAENSAEKDAFKTPALKNGGSSSTAEKKRVPTPPLPPPMGGSGGNGGGTHQVTPAMANQMGAQVEAWKQLQHMNAAPGMTQQYDAVMADMLVKNPFWTPGMNAAAAAQAMHHHHDHLLGMTPIINQDFSTSLFGGVGGAVAAGATGCYTLDSPTMAQQSAALAQHNAAMFAANAHHQFGGDHHQTAAAPAANTGSFSAPPGSYSPGEQSDASGDGRSAASVNVVNQNLIAQAQHRLNPGGVPVSNAHNVHLNNRGANGGVLGGGSSGAPNLYDKFSGGEGNANAHSRAQTQHMIPAQNGWSFDKSSKEKVFDAVKGVLNKGKMFYFLLEERITAYEHKYGIIWDNSARDRHLQEKAFLHLLSFVTNCWSTDRQQCSSAEVFWSVVQDVFAMLRYYEVKPFTKFFSMAAAGYEKFVSKSSAKSVDHFNELEKFYYEICPPGCALLNAHLDSAYIRLLMIFGDELTTGSPHGERESGYDMAFHLIIKRRKEYKPHSYNAQYLFLLFQAVLDYSKDCPYLEELETHVLKWSSADGMDANLNKEKTTRFHDFEAIKKETEALKNKQVDKENVTEGAAAEAALAGAKDA